MFHLSPIKLWRNISLVMFIIAMTFTIIGTFAINDELVIHWNETGAPNYSTGKWILWAMLLLAFLSMFAHSSLKHRDVWCSFVRISIYVDHNKYHTGNL